LATIICSPVRFGVESIAYFFTAFALAAFLSVQSL
jgi:hypothetical protein